jgi:murein peptide amidase A
MRFLPLLTLALAGLLSVSFFTESGNLFASGGARQRVEKKQEPQATEAQPAETAAPAEEPAKKPKPPAPDLVELCVTSLKALPGRSKPKELADACAQALVLEPCFSEKGVQIFHYDKAARASEKDPKRILVFSLIHGDEFPSGSVARSWMERLTTIEPRNHWRVVPVLNPDGVKNRTRVNANGVDLNRNFPTEDWDEKALHYWETKTKKDKRRYPGPTGNSEQETRCAIAHIDDFNPDLILSIHTPYGVLDFDGPKIPPPNFPNLPWRSLGNYPGSLGRYMWVDRAKPTLTIELHGNDVGEKLEKFDRLQDITGDIAIKSEKILKGQNGERPSPEPAPAKPSSRRTQP